MENLEANEAVTNTKKKGISGSTIKIIAIVAMFIDHLAASLLTRILYSASPESFNQTLYGVIMVMRLIGRLGFPIFCFLLVEGFHKTRNRRKYALRLGMFALISEIPFDLAFHGQVLETGYQNVFFTLLIGILLLCAYVAIDSLTDKTQKGVDIGLALAAIIALPLYVAYKFAGVSAQVVYAVTGADYTGIIFAVVFVPGVILLAIAYLICRKKVSRKLLLTICGYAFATVTAMAVAGFLRTDYAGIGVLTIAAMYLFRKNRVLEMTAGCTVLTVCAPIEFTAFLTLIPVAKYNGERGLRMKYFFYAFYPVHLLLLWFIAYLMGIGSIPVV